MSDTPRKDQVEQLSENVEESTNRFSDLPDEPLTDQDAQAVKGGLSIAHDDESPKEARRLNT